MPPVIEFDHVGKRYARRSNRPRSFREMFIALVKGRRASGEAGDSLWAVRDVSFAINPGETTGLIGPNGAGKSTAFKLISRIIAPTAGRVTVNGRVAALLELGTGFHPELSGRENIFLSGALIGMSRAEMKRKFDAIVAFSELAEFIDEPVKHYSSGMFARLAFAVSIHLDPEILLVDEVLAVGDQAFQMKCLDRIASLQREGVTICLVTHSADVVRSMCSRALWFDHGRLLADGNAESVVRHYLDRAAAAEAKRLAEAGVEAQKRWGSGAIEISGVRLLDAGGAEQTIFETGQLLTVSIVYRVREPVPAPVFGLAIHRQDGVHICGPNTAFGNLRLPALAGEGAVTYTIPDLALLEGVYQISVAVVNETDTETYDYHDRVYSFRVMNQGDNRQERYGLVTLSGEWAHTPHP
jgi:lipopolysaccharide transport system ATP-binding protein